MTTTTERDDGLRRLTKHLLDKDDYALIDRWQVTDAHEGRKVVLVGRLQRLLNEDLHLYEQPHPTSELLVDGKYGPITDGALMRSRLSDKDLGTELWGLVCSYRQAQHDAAHTTLVGCNDPEGPLLWELDGARSELTSLCEAVRSFELALPLLRTPGERDEPDVAQAMRALKTEVHTACDAYVAAWGKLHAARKRGAQ